MYFYFLKGDMHFVYDECGFAVWRYMQLIRAISLPEVISVSGSLSWFLPLTGKFESWLGRHSTPTASPHHLPPSGHNRTTTDEREKQLETLQQQLHTKQTLVEQLQVLFMSYM